MNSRHDGVAYLKKIGLSMVAGTSGKAVDLADEPVRLNFIYGVGKDGISLFEKAIFGKQPGDEVTVAVTRRQADEILGHLRQPIESAFDGRADFFLKARVDTIETPSQREIIQAIAGGGSGGCDCGCGCS